MKVVGSDAHRSLSTSASSITATYEEFEWVAMERRFPARRNREPTGEGLGVLRARRSTPSKGGAPRAHVDALRLMAVFLAHWDNKAENQRLVCLSREWRRRHAVPGAVPAAAGRRRDVRSAESRSRRRGKRAAVWEDRRRARSRWTSCRTAAARSARRACPRRGAGFWRTCSSSSTDAQLAELFTGAQLRQTSRPVQRGRTRCRNGSACSRQRVQAISEGPACPEA